MRISGSTAPLRLAIGLILAVMLLWLPPMAVTSIDSATAMAAGHAHMHDDEEDGEGAGTPSAHAQEHIADHSHEVGGAIDLLMLAATATPRHWRPACIAAIDLMAIFRLERPPRGSTTI